MMYILDTSGFTVFAHPSGLDPTGFALSSHCSVVLWQGKLNPIYSLV
jgi:hypothetical protein